MDGRRCYKTASEPLTDEQIQQAYGCYLEEAWDAFIEDVSYCQAMMEHGTLISYKRKMAELQVELTARNPRKNETRKEMVRRIASQRGIIAPAHTVIRTKVKDRPTRVV